MKNKTRKTPAELEGIARDLCRETLKAYSLPENVRKDLCLGTQILDDRRTFELYVPGERPEHARVIVRVEVDALTGEASIEVFLPTAEP